MTDEKVKAFFSEKPAQFELFQFIKKVILSFGETSIKVSKSQISFGNNRQFAWVWLPMPWDKSRPKNSIVLSFSLKEKISNHQIVEVVEPYPGRFMHHIIIEKESDVNKEVEKWLNEAYEFGSKPKFT